MIGPRVSKTVLFAAMLIAVTAGSGCQSFIAGVMGIPAIPVNRVPPEILYENEKDDLIDISLTRLRQDPPDVYLLGPGDILGVWIDNVLGNPEELPPVHFPEQGDDPPAVGVPVPVRDDGTINLPFVPDLFVEGTSLEEATRIIEREYFVNSQILKKDEAVQSRIVVTLIKKRQHRILVVREEAGGLQEVTKRGRGDNIDLDAYENDVLHALNETGGLPGLDARNEIVIYRGLYKEGENRDEILAAIAAGKDPCFCNPPPPNDPSVVRIPLRYHPSNPPDFTQDDIILEDGDIILIEARDRELYYTGGALQGGEFPLPRDYDLRLLGAIAKAGGIVGTAGAGIASLGRGSGSARSASGCPPSQAIVLRKLCNGQTIPIRVDLRKALTDQRHNLLIQPEDTIIVQYTLAEEIYNAGLNLIQFNFLFNGFRGGGF
jgi:protein involved in polysaccharide export with SLBB domain